MMQSIKLSRCCKYLATPKRCNLTGLTVTLATLLLLMAHLVNSAPVSMPFNTPEIKANSIDQQVQLNEDTKRPANTVQDSLTDSERLRATLQNFLDQWNSLPASFAASSAPSFSDSPVSAGGQQQPRQLQPQGVQQNILEPAMIVSLSHEGDAVLKAPTRMQSQRRLGGPLRFG